MNIAENVLLLKQDFDKVYEAGKIVGNKKFWDDYQENGARKYCAFLYAGNGWNNETFKPEHDLQPTNAKSMFQYCHIENYKEHLDSLGRKIDFSQSTNNDGVFHGCPYLKHLPDIDFSNTHFLVNTFSWSGIETIDSIKINERVSFDRTFDGMPDLKEIRIIGLIRSAIDFGSSPKLSTQSIINIFDALSMMNGSTLTLNKTAVDNMDFTNTEYDSWEELRATKSWCWTIVLRNS